MQSFRKIYLTEKLEDKMKDFFEIRTNKHIELVKKYLNKSSLTKETIDNIILKHDASKFKEPEYTPYLYITWNYKCKTENVEFKIPDKLKEKCDNATFYHIKNNAHHPEYWDNSLTKNSINSKDRDKPSNIITDGTKMPDESIIEMCCDWCAVSEERSTDPHEWAKNNINVRWKFNENQENLIYETLNKIWRK